MSAKEILLDVAEKLPPDATMVDAIYELEFRQAVAEGLAELDRGEGIPIEQVKARIFPAKSDDRTALRLSGWLSRHEPA